jgi:hypothetical protein
LYENTTGSLATFSPSRSRHAAGRALALLRAAYLSTVSAS